MLSENADLEMCGKSGKFASDFVSSRRKEINNRKHIQATKCEIGGLKK